MTTPPEPPPGPTERAWLRGPDAFAEEPEPPDAPGQVAVGARHLAHFWLLQDVPAAELERLAPLCLPRRYADGATIFREGDPSDGLYLVEAGTVFLSAADRTAGDEVLLAGVAAGDCFGEMGVIDGSPRSATALAVGPTRCLYLPREPFRDLMERAAAVPLKLLVLLCERLRRTDHLLADIPGTAQLISPQDRQRLGARLPRPPQNPDP